MTATSTENDLDTIKHLDFDSSIGCEWPEPDKCIVDAKWIIKNKCCGFQAFLCTEHKDAAVTKTSILLGLGKRLGCISCRVSYPRFATMEELFIVTPIE